MITSERNISQWFNIICALHLYYDLLDPKEAVTVGIPMQNYINLFLSELKYFFHNGNHNILSVKWQTDLKSEKLKYSRTQVCTDISIFRGVKQNSGPYV